MTASVRLGVRPRASWFADQLAHATFYDLSRPAMKKVVQGTAPMVTRISMFRVEEHIVIAPHR